MNATRLVTRLGLFSNRWYWLKLTLPIILLLAICGYSLVFGPHQRIYVSDCLDDPETCDGRMAVATVAPVTSISDDGFTVRCFERDARIKGQISGLTEGQFVDVRGRFHKEDGRVEMERYHVCSRSARWIKLGVSLIPLAVVGWMLAESFGRRPEKE